ncbi:hypothetical protein [Gardnerella vaginalis]|uniref:hypothetical protein n=1 Tax=Gardnerella vaginalis TaxID=2702 RepID=UPI0003528D1D|nr:hypothetical protein [Gardnerella vaginalis]EPI42653.1 hypothetical protein HMPREF1584_00885 [Gardnerella vaginalis JCP8481A]EPI43642.1 hypothetical protein HMPREF1585_00397 [Gardnerella vaginalis JCP8481B]
MTAPESNIFLKRVRAIFDFAAHRRDSGVARASKEASCAALRLNASKNASRKESGSCASRALLSLFVASATLLATFVIAPTSALSAGENAGVSVGANTVSTEKADGAKSDSAKTDGEKQQSNQSESNSAELNKGDTGSSSNLNKDNKESNPVEKQQNAGNKVDDKAKSTDSDVKKNAKDAQKKDVDSTEAANGTDRGANEEPQLPEECKGNKKYNTPEKCYSITYGNKNIVDIKGDNDRPYTKVPQIFNPTIEVAGNNQTTLPKDVWLELKAYGSTDYVKYAFFKGENDKNDNYTAKSTRNVSNSDGSIRFFPSKWLKAAYYKFKVVIHYKGVSKTQFKIIKVKLATKDLPNPQSGDLLLSLYDFVNKQDDVAVSGNKITIKPKSDSQGAGGSTTDSNDKKDVYDSINKLFIDSQSKDKRGELYHHMICNDGANNYTVDNFNGLSLKDKKDNPSVDNQTQFKHMENQNNPKDSTADKYALYENDDYTERSQSWISGMPKKAGTFECKVFAFKNANLERKGGGKYSIDSTVLDEFNARVKDNAGKQSLFQGNIVEDKWTNKASITKGVDWDYKSVTIEVKSNKPPEPEPPKIGDNDLTLKVYPFKNGDGSLPTALSDKNNDISAMLGMELKPFVDATSAADSTKKITLRVLCSKGEKKVAADAGGGGSAVGDSNGATAVDGSSSSAQSGSQSEQPSGSSQAAENLEYKTWSSNLAELGLSVPADNNQNTCHSNEEGETICESSDPSKKVAARTDKEVSIKPSIKPTEVGDYQCVVYALKPEALTKFDDAISKAAQSGSLTPTLISSALTSATPTAFKEHKDFAAFTLNIQLASNFTLPNTGGQSWNLQLGILAALLVNLLAAGFVVSQSERGRKLILGRWRGLCNHV